MTAHQKSRRRAITVLTAAVLFLGVGATPSASSVRPLEPRRAPAAVLATPAPVRAYAPAPETDTSGIDTALAGVHGSASWYCNSDRSRAVLSRCTRGHPDRPGCVIRTGVNCDYYAAAGPDLRVGKWRGRVVEVHAENGRSVTVRLIDWCACPRGVIDLYADAMWKLGGSGRLDVTVSWTGRLTLPNTDTEGP